MFLRLCIVIAVVLCVCGDVLLPRQHAETVLSTANALKDDNTVNTTTPAPNAFAYLILAIQTWPGTCLTGNSCMTDVLMNKPLWTIHGLWPSGQKGSPSFCRKEELNMTAIANLQSKMTEIWPTYYAKKPVVGFWGHEWKKHGTCYEDINTQREYFETAINMYYRHNVEDILKFNGITPNAKIPTSLNKFNQAFTNGLGRSAAFSCKLLKGQNLQTMSVLNEIRLCFDRDLQPMFCPIQSSCRRSLYYMPPGVNRDDFIIDNSTNPIPELL